MKRIGIVDIDTSHPAAWLHIERELGFEVVGFCDRGTVHPPEVVAQFAREHGLVRFANVADLAAAVDIAMIHSCNWDEHRPTAEILLQAGKAVFIDKPVAGSAADRNALLEWAQRGARLTGGSCLSYAREITAYLKKTSVGDGTRAHTVLAGCGTDEFNYGIHAFSAVFAVLGTDCFKVRAARQGPLDVIHLVWKDHRQAVVTVGRHPWIQTHLTLVAEKSLEQMRIATSDIYRPMLETVLPYLAGAEVPGLLPFSAVVQPEIAALAAKRSLAENERWVTLAEMADAPENYDGAVFAREYRRQRYPA